MLYLHELLCIICLLLQKKSWEIERESLLKDLEAKDRQIESLKVSVVASMYMLYGCFVGAL